MVSPQPAHHLRQHRTAHVVAVDADAPHVIDVIALRNQRVLEPHILVEPVARLIVSMNAAIIGGNSPR